MVNKLVKILGDANNISFTPSIYLIILLEKNLPGGVHADLFIFFQQRLYGSLLLPCRTERYGATLLPAVGGGGQRARGRGGRYKK